MKTSKPIRRILKRLFIHNRKMMPTAKQRGDGKKPLQLLRKQFNKMASVRDFRNVDRVKKNPLMSVLRCSNNAERPQCPGRCNVCKTIDHLKRKQLWFT